MKIGISGASAFVNRMYEACGSYQWAREFLKNSLEAGATKIEFGIEWQAVANSGVYRRTVIDNGCGMNRNELLTFFSMLGVGAKKIGGIHENFGVGAKIASLPWNPEGVVVISYKGGQASMIWIVLDPDSGDYELVEFETDSGTKCVIEPQEIENVDWGAIRPAWIGPKDVRAKQVSDFQSKVPWKLNKESAGPPSKRATARAPVSLFALGSLPLGLRS